MTPLEEFASWSGDDRVYWRAPGADAVAGLGVAQAVEVDGRWRFEAAASAAAELLDEGGGRLCRLRLRRSAREQGRGTDTRAGGWWFRNGLFEDRHKAQATPTTAMPCGLKMEPGPPIGTR